MINLIILIEYADDKKDKRGPLVTPEVGAGAYEKQASFIDGSHQALSCKFYSRNIIGLALPIIEKYCSMLMLATIDIYSDHCRAS
jgi:hypothetical protein